MFLKLQLHSTVQSPAYSLPIEIILFNMSVFVFEGVSFVFLKPRTKETNLWKRIVIPVVGCTAFHLRVTI
jgi:hypothetical protein